MAEPMMGQVMMFGGNYAPRDWALCDGALLNVVDFGALFSLLGTNYGGDGRTSFGVPDLRGRSPLGWGTGPGLSSRQLGQRSGREINQLSTSQMPEHNHSISSIELSGDVTGKVYAATSECDEGSPAGAYLTVPADDLQIYTKSDSDKVAMNENMLEITNTLAVSADANTGDAGGHTPVDNMHPWLCMNYIIALEGYYPPRS